MVLFLLDCYILNKKPQIFFTRLPNFIRNQKLNKLKLQLQSNMKFNSIAIKKYILIHYLLKLLSLITAPKQHS